jgi:hypothetical protein
VMWERFTVTAPRNDLTAWDRRDVTSS